MSRPSHRQSLGEATPSPLVILAPHHRTSGATSPRDTRIKIAARPHHESLGHRQVFPGGIFGENGDASALFYGIPSRWRRLFVEWCNDTGPGDDQRRVISSQDAFDTGRDAREYNSLFINVVLHCVWGDTCCGRGSITESWRRLRKLTLPRNVELSFLILCMRRRQNVKVCGCFRRRWK